MSNNIINSRRMSVNNQLSQIKKYIETLYNNHNNNNNNNNNNTPSRIVSSRTNNINTKLHTHINNKHMFIDEALNFYNQLIIEQPSLLIEDIKSHINYFISLDISNRENILSMFADVHSKDTILLEKPKLFTILESSLSIFHKKLVLYKLQTLEAMSPSDSEYFKLSQWIDNILEIPFNIYKQPNYINTHTHTNTNTNTHSINNIYNIDSMDTDTNTEIDIDIFS